MVNVKKPSNFDSLVKTHSGFLSWIQEFSKKIVAITFAIFVVVHVYLLIMYTVEYFSTGNMQDLALLLSETHTTFREVIGGYVLKAALENAIKIGGSIVTRYIDNKYPPVEGGLDDEEDVYEEEFYTDQRSGDC